MTSDSPSATPRDFCHGVLGRTGIPVHRLGLSATYRPGARTVEAALDEGMNLMFLFNIDTQMKRVLRQQITRGRRDRLVVATGAYNWIWWHGDIVKTCERQLRALGTDSIDLFLFLGVMKAEQMPPRVFEDLVRLREQGKVRAVGLSTHDRRFAGQLAQQGLLDVLMIRYNAAHPGAEQDIFPHLQPHDPGVIAYTATRWRMMMRRTRGWPREEPVPTAGQAYRFVLSNPAVDVCLTAPRNERELRENLRALEDGPLQAEEMASVRRFGAALHARRKWFM